MIILTIILFWINDAVIYIFQITKIIINNRLHLQNLCIIMRKASLATLHISIIFFLLFTAYNSFFTIMTRIYEEINLVSLGPLSLFINYTGFVISTLIAPASRLHYKTQILIGTILYTLNFCLVFAGYFLQPTWKYVLNISGALIGGLSAGYLWIGQGKYMHLVLEKTGEIDVAGKYFARFKFLYCLSNVAAGCIITFGLGLFSSMIYFIILIVFGMLSVVLTFFLQDLQKQQTNLQRNKFQKRDQLITQKSLQESMLCKPQRQNKQLIKSQHLQIIKQQYSVLKSVTATINFYWIMYAVIPLLILDGFCLGFMSSQVTHLLPQSSSNLQIGYCTIVLGIGSVIGGYSSGILTTIFGCKITAFISIFIFLLTCGLVQMALYFNTVIQGILTAGAWGFCLFFIEGLMYVICTQNYKGRPQAYAINKQFHSIVFVLFQVTVLLTRNNLNIQAVIGGAMVFTIPAFWFVSKMQ